MPDTVDLPPPPPLLSVAHLRAEAVADVIGDAIARTFNDVDIEFPPYNPPPNIDTARADLPPANAPHPKATKASNIAAREARQKARNDASATNLARVEAATRYLDRTPILTIIRNSPTHPLTAEFVRRHMQSFNSNYENPAKSPTTPRLWLQHIGAHLPTQASNLLSSSDIIFYFNALCRHLCFDRIPNPNPEEAPYDAKHLIFAELDTCPHLTYNLTTLPQKLRFTYRNNQAFKVHANFNTKPLSVTGSLNYTQGLAVLEPDFARLLQGLDTSIYNINRVERNKTPYLHCLAYLSTHLLRYHWNYDDLDLFFARLAENQRVPRYEPPPTDDYETSISKLAYTANLPTITREIFDAEPVLLFRQPTSDAFNSNRMGILSSSLNDLLQPPLPTPTPDDDDDEDRDDDTDDDGTF